MRQQKLLVVAACLGIWLLSAGPAQAAREQSCSQATTLSHCLFPGPDPLLVLLTGLGEDMQSWAPAFLDALSEFAGVLIYDRRGLGESAPPPAQPVTAEAAAVDLHQLLQALHIDERVILVGHSLGGLYAQYFARNYPQEVAAVVLARKIHEGLAGADQAVEIV